MTQRSFDVSLSDDVYRTALQRVQNEGGTLETLLSTYISQYGKEGAAQPPASGQPETYVVQSGDTIANIARKLYGDVRGYPLIQRANNINEAGHIWVGQTLVIPLFQQSRPAPIPKPMPTAAQVPPATPLPTPEANAPSTPPATEPPQSTQPAPTTPVNAGLVNGDFEEFQPRIRRREPVVWRDQYPEEFGKGWEMKLISEVKKGRTRYLSSPTFGRVAKDLFGGSGLNYAYGGGNSQVIASQYAYHTVFWQTVAAQPGQKYRFSGMMVSFYKGTDNPATPDKIFKTIGIDPTGGDDRKSANVVWGKRDSTDHAWIDPSVEAVAQGSAITVFIHIENTEENVGTTELNLIHLDKFKLEKV